MLSVAQCADRCMYFVKTEDVQTGEEDKCLLKETELTAQLNSKGDSKTLHTL